MFGVSIGQVIFYYSSFPKDSRLLKFGVSDSRYKISSPRPWRMHERFLQYCTLSYPDDRLTHLNLSTLASWTCSIPLAWSQSFGIYWCCATAQRLQTVKWTSLGKSLCRISRWHPLLLLFIGTCWWVILSDCLWGCIDIFWAGGPYFECEVYRFGDGVTCSSCLQPLVYHHLTRAKVIPHCLWRRYWNWEAKPLTQSFYAHRVWISKKQKSLQISDADISQVSRNNKVVTGAIVSTLQYISQRPWAEGPRCLLRLFRHVRLFASLCSIDAKLNNAVLGSVRMNTIMRSCLTLSCFWPSVCVHSVWAFSVLLEVAPCIEYQHYCRFHSRNWPEFFAHAVCALLHLLNAQSFISVLQYPALASAASSICDVLITISVAYFLRLKDSQSPKCEFFLSSISCSTNIAPQTISSYPQI